VDALDQRAARDGRERSVLGQIGVGVHRATCPRSG
jgi:hypothetical protein